MADSTYQPLVYRSQGGSAFIVASGGYIDIESGGQFRIGGVAVTASAAALNALAGSFTDLDLGASGTAGSLDIFPTTAANGKLIITCTNNGAARNLSLTNVAQTSGSGTLKFPDMAGATGQLLATTTDYKCTVTMNGAARTLDLTGNLTLAGNLTTTGGAATITVPGGGATINVGGDLTTVGALTTTGGAVTIAAPAAGGTLTMTGNVTYTGAFNPTFAIPSSSTWTFPTGGGTLALATGAETGTSASSFTIDNDSGIGKFALAVNSAGTNNTVTLKAPVTTQDVTLTLPDAATDTLCAIAATQTLAGKTLTAPVVNGMTTAAAANNFTLHTGSGAFTTPLGAFTFYGNVATNGNVTFDWSGSNGTFKTSSGAVTINGDTTLALGKVLTVQGATSGGIKLAPIAVGTNLTTLINQAGTINVTLPSATCTLPGLGLANAFSAAQSVAKDDETDGVVDVLTLTHSSSDDNATAADGVGVSFQLENATGTSTVEEWASLDVVSTTITNGSEDGDIVLKLMANGTVTEVARIDSSDQSLTIGQNATDADNVDKIRIYGQTSTKGSLVIQSVANTDNVDVTITNAAHATAGRTYTFGDAGAAKYVAYTATATGAPTRSDMTAETSNFTLNLTDARVWNGVTAILPNAAAADDMGMITGTLGTDPIMLQGIDFKAGTTDERCRFSFTVPPNYVDGGAITVRVRAGMNTTVSDGTATVDCEVYSNDEDGTVSADLCETAAQDINNLTAADKDFVITPTGIVAGEQLDIVLSFGGTDGATGTAVIPQINKVSVRLATKG